MIWPAAALQAQGYPVKIIPPSHREGIGGDIDTRTGTLVNARVPSDAEVVVLQRVSMTFMRQAIPKLREQGVAVVVDMDDDLARVDPSNPAFHAYHPKGRYGERHNWELAAQSCLDATYVTVSTPALLRRYAPHGRGVVIENGVPAAYLGVPRVDNDTFGWPGSVHSHPQDLQVTGPAIARLIREGRRYRGIGPIEGLREALNLDQTPEVTGNLDMNQWPVGLATLGVGMAPLADTAFNAAKSWLKPLEMMACGVPWVASPRAEYRRLQDRAGVGLMAADPKDWFRQLKRLINSADLRAEFSEKGRAAAGELTIEGTAWRWLEAWSQAFRIQRGHATVDA